MKTLTQLIEARKFYWVHPGIIEENFPIQENDGEEKEYKPVQKGALRYLHRTARIFAPTT